MSKLKWDDTREALEELGVGPPKTSREQFWRLFSSRASGLPRDEQVAPCTDYAFGLRLAAACCCLALVAAIVAFLNLNPAAAPTQASQSGIRSLDVRAANSGVTILHDESSDSTILWIRDME